MVETMNPATKRSLVAWTLLSVVLGCGGVMTTTSVELATEPGAGATIPTDLPAARPLVRLDAAARATLDPYLSLAKETEAPDVQLRVATHAKPDPPPTPKRMSKSLVSGLFNPMPGGVIAGYAGDTGLDIAGNRQPVFAIAAGTLDYSEPGHTLWVGPGDTANTIRVKLDAPIEYRGRKITHAWYAHLSELSYHQREGARNRIHVEAGEQLGVSGVANGSPHLHIGLLFDNIVSQRWGNFLMEQEVREVLGNFQHRQRLPSE
jgi:murein DD-endopeptidase MepM/ murein hydrolase activator NlpD